MDVHERNWYRSSVNSVAFSPDGLTLASGSDNTKVTLWDVATGELKATFEGHKEGVTSVAFSPDGLTLASGSRDHSIKLWDVATSAIKATLGEHDFGVYSVVFSPDGTSLASGGAFSGIKLWDLATGDMKASFADGSVHSLVFSLDGLMLLIGSTGCTINLWDITTGEVKMRFEGHIFGPPYNPFRDEFVAPQSTTVQGHKYEVKSVAFSPNGSTIASGSKDKTMKLWDVATGELKATFEGHTDGINSVAFSPDGLMLASGGGLWAKMWKDADDKTVRLWDVETGEVRTVLTGHRSPINSVAFSPDGLIIASGSDDGTIKLWDVATGELKVTLVHRGDLIEPVFHTFDKLVYEEKDIHWLKQRLAELAEKSNAPE